MTTPDFFRARLDAMIDLRLPPAFDEVAGINFRTTMTCRS